MAGVTDITGGCLGPCTGRFEGSQLLLVLQAKFMAAAASFATLHHYPRHVGKVGHVCGARPGKGMFARLELNYPVLMALVANLGTRSACLGHIGRRSMAGTMAGLAPHAFCGVLGKPPIRYQARCCFPMAGNTGVPGLGRSSTEGLRGHAQKQAYRYEDNQAGDEPRPPFPDPIHFSPLYGHGDMFFSQLPNVLTFPSCLSRGNQVFMAAAA
jgi:hypothetical protein